MGTPVQNAAAVEAVRLARLEYVKATNRLATIRASERAAVVAEAQALEQLKAARISLKKEAGDE